MLRYVMVVFLGGVLLAGQGLAEDFLPELVNEDIDPQLEVFDDSDEDSWMAEEELEHESIDPEPAVEEPPPEMFYQSGRAWGHGGMVDDFRPIPPYGFTYRYGPGVVTPFGYRPIGYPYPGWIITCPGSVGITETKQSRKEERYRSQQRQR